MIGAIIGDIIGSVYEWKTTKSTDFELFTPYTTYTDDTVLTIAVADAILNQADYAEKIYYWGNEYPDAGYGIGFINWLHTENPQPYNSWGNGSAMRVSPVGFAFNDERTVLKEAKKSAEISHNHPEGIKGAQAVAIAVFLARTGRSKPDIKNFIKSKFGYDLDRTLNEIRPLYTFDVSCQGSVPVAIIAFLESENFEDAVRNAISLGGDSDTLACMAGAIAQAYYKKIPKPIMDQALEYLPQEFLEIIRIFEDTFRIRYV
jgi:ADP-ribosylglycohydrolase